MFLKTYFKGWVLSVVVILATVVCDVEQDCNFTRFIEWIFIGTASVCQYI